MSLINYDKAARRDILDIVSRKDKLRDKNIDKIIKLLHNLI